MTSEIENDAVNPIIEIYNLIKTYKLGDVLVHALNDISLTIPHGQILFVMGPSGSGKTTLLNLIGGIDKITKGKIVVCNEEISSFSSKKLTIYRKKRLSFVFQFYSLIPTLTTVENVELSMELMKYNKKTIRQKAKDYILMVGLENRMFNYPSQLSGGERQRVAIARALAKDPDILLIDEPTGQLDQDSGKKIIGLIQKIAKKHNKTVILVTHDTEFIQYADRIVTLRSGKLIDDKINKLVK